MSEIEKNLTQKGCRLSSPMHQYDVIYAQRDIHEWEASKKDAVFMRIRREKDRSIFNLKRQQSNELDNIEYESEVSDPDAIHNILSQLGYVPWIEVRKIRRKGKLGQYEVCLDEVEELGSFIELEKLVPDSEDGSGVQEELLQILESLGCSRADQETRGYDTQIHQFHKKNHTQSNG